MTRFDALLVNIPPKLWDIFFFEGGGEVYLEPSDTNLCGVQL